MRELLGKVTSVEVEPKRKRKVLDEKMVPESSDLEQSLLDGIDKAISRVIVPRYKKNNGFHPSTTNECARYAVYLFRGIELPQTHSPQVQRIFDNGHAMHERVTGYFKEMGILVHDEYPISHKNPPLEGTLDAIIEWDGPKVVEIKSIGDAGFIYRKLYHKPKDEHYRQIQLYMHSTGIFEGFLLYENKNTQELLPIHVHYDEPFILKLFKKYDKIYGAYEKGILPARPYKSTSVKCERCQLKEHCFSDPDEGQKI